MPPDSGCSVSPCSKDDLDIYEWEIILNYIEKSVSLCVSEVKALEQNKNGIEPETIFVIA